jgi:hypothetical protein
MATHLKHWSIIILCAFALYILYTAVNKPAIIPDKVTTETKEAQPIIIEGAKWSPQVTQPPINVVIPKSNDSLTAALINALNRLNAVKDYDTTVTAVSGGDTTGTAKVHIKISDNSLQSFSLGLQTFNKTIEHTVVQRWAVSGGLLTTYKAGEFTPYYTAGLQLPKVSYEAGKEISGKGFFVGAKIVILRRNR